MQSATLLPEEQWNKNSVLSCAITAGEDGYFVTSIPMQNGLKLYVDGKVTKLEKVNTAFAGAKVTAGTHTVDLQFEPPGQRYGIMASLLSVILFGIWAADLPYGIAHANERFIYFFGIGSTNVLKNI